jgi:hypothetical protein
MAARLPNLIDREQLYELSFALKRLADLMTPLTDASVPAKTPPIASVVRAILRHRRMRDKFIGGRLFADPAWDMLLDLLAARHERRRVSVSSLCVAAAVPPTTALRWIKVLELEGHLAKRADPNDRRRIYVEITETTSSRLESLLTAIASDAHLAV